jgi:SAM-dependent methyltransferase
MTLKLKEVKKKSYEDHSGVLIESVNGFNVIECDKCDFKHIIPIPTPEELADVYKEDYYTKEKPLYLERMGEDLDWWNMVNSERYELFERHLGRARRRLLEVGSGPGFFLQKGMERGWEVRGIEPSEKAAEHARGLGLDIVCDFLTDERAKELGTFDVVYMHEVLEHIPDPEAMVRRAFSLLQPGGLCQIVVPNDYNPFQAILRSTMDYEPWWVAPPHHINYFNPDSLCELMKRSGFDVVDFETTFPIDLFLLMGENYVGDDKVGRECHKKRMKFELNMERSGLSGLKHSLYRTFGAHGIGREIVILAKRP